MERYIVGLMSGTSVDGIDAALTCIKGSGTATRVQVLAFDTYQFPQKVVDDIFEAMDPERSSTPLICSLNFELGRCYAEAAKRVCQKAHFDLARLDAIGSHGQTIFHIPKAYDHFIPSTLQIGEPAVIAYETKTLVVSNFRVMDMAAGGQGAPLVPYVDYLLFRNPQYNIALLNIGGVANITVIPKQAELDEVYAFDTGPGNMIIDALVKHYYGISYDPDGQHAEEGEVHDALLSEMMNDPYLSETPPKTTGRERFGSIYVRKLLQKWGHLAPNDLIATATQFTAKTIAFSYETFILPKNKVDVLIVSGGGSHNQVLMRSFKSMLKDVNVKTSDDFGISSDEKEAVAFAVLANEMLSGNPANVPLATGASRPIVLGNLTPYYSYI